ncbi:MAG TPA: LEA type 2 family protein [Chitinophagales bacterium]|nr:LEA type 2 family protein [Chitinophagales bacterium]
MFSRFLFLLLSLFVFASCSSLKPLEYRSLNNFNVSSLTSTPQLTFDLTLYNPNTVGAKLKDFNVELELNGVKLATAALADVSHAGAQSTFTIPMSINTSIEQLAQFLPAGINLFSSGSTIPVHLNGSVTVKKFIFRKTFPFDVQEALDTKKIRLGK